MRGPWERLFRTEIPDALEHFPRIAEKAIRNFESEVRKRIQAHPRLSSIEMRGVSFQWYIASMREMVEEFSESITTLQKEISRQFEPSIAGSMRIAYKACADENGKSLTEDTRLGGRINMYPGRGSFARMKSTLCHYVLDSRTEMFRRPLKAARAQLICKCNAAEKDFLVKFDTLVCGMRTEYHQVITGHDLSEISKKARAEVSKILAHSDKSIQRG